MKRDIIDFVSQNLKYENHLLGKIAIEKGLTSKEYKQKLSQIKMLESYGNAD